MADNLDRIYDDVDRLLLDGDVSPSDRGAVTLVAARVVADYQTAAGRGVGTRLARPDQTVAEIVTDVCDRGVLGLVLDEPGVENVLIEGDAITVFVHGRPRMRTEPTTARRNLHVISQLLLAAGVSLDDSNPTVDGVQVLDGRGRLAASIPPISPVLSATLRLKVDKEPTLEDLILRGTLPAAAADLLALCLRAKAAFLVSGEAGSGKTTLLSAVLHRADPSHVVRIVEEFREIDFTPALGNSYQIKRDADEGQQCRTIAGLLRWVLRMLLDVVVVGEVRGPEAWDLSNAAGVGAGFAGTIHAPNASRALERLVRLARNHPDRPEPDTIRETFSELIAFVVHVHRGETASGEYVHEVSEIRALLPPVDPSRLFSSEPLFERAGGIGTPMTWTGMLPPAEVVARLERHLDGRMLRDLLGGTA